MEPGRDLRQFKGSDISIPEVLLKDKKLKKNLIEEEMIKPLIKPRPAESIRVPMVMLWLSVVLWFDWGGYHGRLFSLRIGAGLVTAALPESLLSLLILS